MKRVAAIAAICLLSVGCEPKELNEWAAWWRGLIVHDRASAPVLQWPSWATHYTGVGPSQTYESCVDAAVRRGASRLNAQVACEAGRFWVRGAQGYLP